MSIILCTLIAVGALQSHLAEPASAAIRVNAADINRGLVLGRLVEFCGTLTEVRQDEIDPKFGYLVLTDESGAMYAPFHLTNATQLVAFENLVGAMIRIRGGCSCHLQTGGRRQTGMEVSISELGSSLTVIRPPQTDPFDAPLLHNHMRNLNPILAGDLKPKKVYGRVLATWQGQCALLRTDTGDITEIQFSPRATLPIVGATIEAVGTPETDLYQLNLSKAIWRDWSGQIPDEPPAEPTTAKHLLTDGNGNREVKTGYAGRTVKIIGLMRELPAPGNTNYRVNLLCGNQSMIIDFSAIPEALESIEAGCRLEVTGVCVLESESWRPQTPFPKAHGFFIVPRTLDDVHIVTHPPWWNRSRLLIAVGSLLAALIAIFIWNRMLQRLVNHRGHQLFDEQIAHASSELRIEERTRLAVELHDSISQSLTGAAMQIDAASLFLQRDSQKSLNHLRVASSTLTACREELRNCIWDLRNQALEEPDMNLALRKTLTPHAANARLVIRFNVPREKLSDHTTHALLRIIRELVTNAVRHGHAQTIRIAGTLEGRFLKFSVSDDGCGFVTSTESSVAQGHFGLQGIRERLRQLDGKLTIESTPGAGTHVSVEISTSLGDRLNERN